MSSIKWMSVLLLFALMSLTVLPVYAGTITVNSLTDSANLAGVCTLREAIARANVGSDGLDCTGVTPSINTINLSVSGSYTLTTGSELNVTTIITIQESNGATAVIEAAATANTAAYRVFNVNGIASQLTLNGVTVRNGGTTSTSLNGGCILATFHGDVTLTGETVVENCNTASDGGAIYTNTSGSVITVTNSTVQNSFSGTFGGGIYVSAARLTLSDATIHNNRGRSAGGVLYSGNALSISGGTFSNNQANGSSTTTRGGGLYASVSSSSTVTISGTTFSGNQALNGTSINQGGAIYKDGSGTLTVSDSVFTGNSVSGTGAGGGVFNVTSGTLTVTSSRIQSNNSSGTTTGDVVASAATVSITGSCIVNNGDNAVDDTDATIITTATNNWWGTSWGPRILGAPALSGSVVSNGDSITGDGTSAVNVSLTDDGDYSTAPTGDWMTTAPTVAGAQCMSCTSVSGIDHAARTCS